MTELFIIRHGEYVFNPQVPPFDLGLTPEGVKQAEKLKERLATKAEFKAEVLISSPLARALQTAQIIAPALELPVIQDEDMREWRNFDGDLEYFERLKELPYGQLADTPPYPGGQTYAEFALQVCAGLNRIVEEHAGKKVAIVAHGGIVEASFINAYSMNPHTPAPVMLNLDPYYTSITHWARKTTKDTVLWRLVSYNDYSHLKND